MAQLIGTISGGAGGIVTIPFSCSANQVLAQGALNAIGSQVNQAR